MPVKQPQKFNARRKLRTRGHIIEELSINYFQHHILLCGFSLEKFNYDYGYDLMLFTYNGNGEIESGCIRIQVKASDNIKLDGNNCIIFDADTSDLATWLEEFDPVLLVIYDAKKNKAYWINIQEYFKSIKVSENKKVQQSFRVKIPLRNKINLKSLIKLAKYKNDLFS